MKDLFDPTERDLYIDALETLIGAEVPFMVGGAFAVYYYTGWWRNTHDIDIYVVQSDVSVAAEALNSAGFSDIGEQAEGDREWIYHSAKGHVIFDVIWRFANLENYISSDWLDRAPEANFLGLDLKFLPLEELCWIKVFVINRHRCDWPDVMRLFKSQCGSLQWDRLLNMLGENWLLLAGLIDVFDWQHPEYMGCIPDSVRRKIAQMRTDYRDNPPKSTKREHLLDPWLYQRADRYAIRRDEQSNG